jgi:autotransporter-associated beta strand protein
MTVSAAEAQKLQLGMFLVSSNNYFKNLSTAGPGATKSDVMITAITPNNDNSSVTLTLKSPGGNLQTTAPTNQNNAVVLFSNINDRAQANSPASVWLANTWPLNSNQPFDNEVYCGNSSTDCPLSKWVGQVKTQINQAVNWGSLAAPLPSSSTLINTVWANPANWYTFNDDQGNPAYNIYSAFWHKPDVSIPFATNTSPYDTTFGAAYGFSEDETAYTFPGSTLPTVQVPSKWDGTLVPGTNVNITLLPWLDSTPTPKPCDGVETVCWATGSGLFATATNWEASEPPSPAAPYSLISFQSAFASAGGTATNNNIPGLTAQGIEYASGAATYTIAGSPIAITGSNGFAISNESDTQQTITAPINLIGSSRLSLNVTEDSSLTLSGGLESAFGWRKAGSGLLTLDQLSRGTASTGRIAVAGGTLALNNSDLSNYAGISSARSTVIEGSGTLPGTGSGSIQGLLIPGSDAQVVGRLNFAGDLAIGLGGGAVLHNLSTDPSNSDLISATGNLSINSDRSYLSVGSVSASGSSYYIPLLTIDSTGGLSGAFSNVVGLNEDQTLVYRSTGNNRGVFLHATGSGPRPTDCILRGDPASTAAPYSTSFCGGRLIVDSGKSTANWTLESTTGSNRIDLAGFASTISFNGVFSGAGDLGFENTGPNTSGLIQLNGQNTYTGPTRIGAGTRVSVNGSIDTSSSLQVDPGGTVGGNGVLPRTSLTTGATIAPGNSIGTLTAAALDLSGGTIAAEIQGPQSDRINVTGAVTNFTGTASLIPFGGGSPFPGFTYTIVNAPASPAFATSSSLNLDQSQLSSALLRFGTTLIQNPLGNPQTFAVQWQPNNPSGATTAAMQALGNGSNNALCLATALDRALNALTSVATNNANNTGTAIGNTGFTTGQAAAAGMSAGFLEALNNLVLLPSGNQLVAAVNSLSAQPYAAFQTMGLETLKQQRESMLAQAGQCLNNGWIVNGKNAKNPLCAFALVQNSTSSIRGNSNLAAYNGGVFSSGFGLEYYPSQQWSMGVNYGYGTSYANNFSTASASVSAGVNSVNLFSQFRASEQWRVRGLLGYSNFNGSASRSIAFIGPGSSLSANPNGNGFTAALETDYAIPLTKASSPTQAMIKPLLGLAWGSYQQSGFSESGNALALSVASNTTNSFVTTAGVEFSTSPIPLSRTRNVTIRPSLLLAYQVDALANNSANKSVNAAFSQAPAVCGSCSSEAQNLGTSALNLTAGVDLQLSQSTALYVNATYNAYSNASQFGYGGGVRVRF